MLIYLRGFLKWIMSHQSWEYRRRLSGSLIYSSLKGDRESKGYSGWGCRHACDGDIPHPLEDVNQVVSVTLCEYSPLVKGGLQDVCQ